MFELNFVFGELQEDEISIMLGGFHLGGNFEVNFGMTALEACSATRNLSTITMLILGPRNNTENVDRVNLLFPWIFLVMFR